MKQRGNTLIDYTIFYNFYHIYNPMYYICILFYTFSLRRCMYTIRLKYCQQYERRTTKSMQNYSSSIFLPKFVPLLNNYCNCVCSSHHVLLISSSIWNESINVAEISSSFLENKICFSPIELKIHGGNAFSVNRQMSIDKLNRWIKSYIIFSTYIHNYHLKK